MAESVDALVSNTSGATHPGSIPGLGTETEKVEKLSPFSFLHSQPIGFADILVHLQILGGGAQIFSAIFLCRGVTGVCALLLCATFWADNIGLPLRHHRKPSVPGVFVTF